MVSTGAARYVEMVDEVNKEISEAVFKLGQDLRNRGFKGVEVEATLVARISSFGVNAEATRKVKFDGFQR